MKNNAIYYMNSPILFIEQRETTDALLVVRRMQEKYRDKKKKSYICFGDIEKAFNRVPRKLMEWAMRKEGLPEVIVSAVMSLYHEAKTKVRVGSELSEEFLVQVGCISKICVVTTAFCKCNGCNLGKCKGIGE